MVRQVWIGMFAFGAMGYVRVRQVRRGSVGRGVVS
jgi:hypothetical protein